LSSRCACDGIIQGDDLWSDPAEAEPFRICTLTARCGDVIIPSVISQADSPLRHLRDRLAQAAAQGGPTPPYEIPGLWVGLDHPPTHHSVPPARFYLERAEQILAQAPPPPSAATNRRWSRQATVYNLLVRASTAFDHNSDGRVSPEPTDAGWRETGTFVKSIALLPILHTMGFNTVHLLPITTVGRHGRKGNLGSVYAVRNPYRLDPLLGEPVLGLGPEAEFAAFVEAAHRLGMRVVVEFVFRTAALDADWVPEHPEWFYWIRADIPDRLSGEKRENAYGAPMFTPEELHQIEGQVGQGNLEDLPPPHPIYRQMFTPPPPAETVHKEGEAWIGTLPDGTRVRIPGAFADWPPDDPQPPWTDVTYLRLYDHPDFNYIAYNTVRMYDRRLARPENAVESLWRRIVGILPFYQEQFGIDGAMIDMGHALPRDLKRRTVEAARGINPDFAFWGETFSYDEDPHQEGYDAVVGNYWGLVWRPQQLVTDLLQPLAHRGLPLPFLAAPETHNTPRAAARPGGPQAARLAWALGCLLPAIPFCHSGLELAETLPVNTGLDFSPDDLPRYPPEVLPLFSIATYGWENEANLVDWIRRTLTLRARFADLVTNPDPATFRLLETDNPNVWTVIRQEQGPGLALVFNLDPERSHHFTLRLPTVGPVLTDLLTGMTWRLDHGHLRATWPPAGCALFELNPRALEGTDP